MRERMCMCMCVYERGGGGNMTENNSWSLSFHQVGFEAQTQPIRLGCKCVYTGALSLAIKAKSHSRHSQGKASNKKEILEEHALTLSMKSWRPLNSGHLDPGPSLKSRRVVHQIPSQLQEENTANVCKAVALRSRRRCILSH